MVFSQMIRAINTGKAMRLLALAAVLPLAAPDAHALAPDKFYAKTAPSVWRVLVYDADGLVFGQGSAVVIGRETLLTNCHVLAKAKRFSVKQDNSTFEAKLEHIDVERDMCQITARHLPAPAVPIGDSSRLAVGQRVYALGNPRGLELTLSDGLISALRKEGSSLTYIQTTAPFSQGSSGGGLFDEDGRLVGITTMIYRDSQNLNFAIPINYLRELPARSAAALEGKSVASSSAPPPSYPKPEPEAPESQAPRATPPARPAKPELSAPPVRPTPPPAAQVRPPVRPESPPPAPVEPPAAPAPALPPAASPAPAPHTAEQPPHRAAPHPLALLRQGQSLVYELTDRITGKQRSVIYRVDEIGSDRIVFNQGERIEDGRGNVLKLELLQAGYFESAMPPGGWAALPLTPGRTWSDKYTTPVGRFDLSAKVAGEEKITIALGVMDTIRVEWEGWVSESLLNYSTPTESRFKAVAWYSPQLNRIVRFTAERVGQPRMPAQDEILELSRRTP